MPCGWMLETRAPRRLLIIFAATTESFLDPLSPTPLSRSQRITPSDLNIICYPRRKGIPVWEPSYAGGDTLREERRSPDCLSGGRRRTARSGLCSRLHLQPRPLL